MELFMYATKHPSFPYLLGDRLNLKAFIFRPNRSVLVFNIRQYFIRFTSYGHFHLGVPLAEIRHQFEPQNKSMKALLLLTLWQLYLFLRESAMHVLKTLRFSSNNTDQVGTAMFVNYKTYMFF